MAEAAQKKDVGQILVQMGKLTTAQWSDAQAQQRNTGRPFEQLLLEQNLVTDEDLTRARAQQMEVGFVRLQDLPVDRSVLPLVDAAIAHKYLILPVGKTTEGALKIVAANWNAQTRDTAVKIANANRLHVAPALATETQVRAAVTQYYGAPKPAARPATALESTPRAERSALPAVIPTPANGGKPLIPAATGSNRRASELFTSTAAASTPRSGGLPGGQVDDIEDAGVDQPIVIQFINRILADAINRGASDIHFEPRRETLDIRYRIDGVLQNVDSIKREFQSAAASRLKIMAEMNIAERRLPQDGRIAVTLDGRSIDMRVSSLPTQFGESVVLRILDKNGVRPQLDQLGFSERNLQKLNSIIHKPHGIFLATGPTGSGKTTTLYSAIQAIHTPDINIITCEDPIEYHLEGIRQSNVNEKAGLTFARQLRAILRQDPDVIYVGEIRDSETAEIAFRAALTGHLVFSTLHCNDAAGAITRLLNMDIDPFLVASSVIGVLAQRLVRTNCPHCARPMTPSDAELAAFGVSKESFEFQHAHFRAGTGCEICGSTGYKGRYSVQELMVMDDVLRNMTLQRIPSNKIRRAAIERGMVPMRQDVANKVMEGLTTFEEAQKRVFIEEHDDD